MKAICRTEATAKRIGKHGYVQGSDCPIEKILPLTLEGAEFLPLRFFRIEEATREDEKVNERLQVVRSAVERAKALGLTDEDIIAMRGAVP